MTRKCAEKDKTKLKARKGLSNYMGTKNVVNQKDHLVGGETISN
jgi:hypothetical protein